MTTKVDAAANDRELVLTRIIDAPREKLEEMCSVPGTIRCRVLY